MNRTGNRAANRTAKLLVMAVIGSFAAMSLFPATARAQRGGGRGAAPGAARGRAGELQMDEQTVIDVATAILHLTDAQKQQVQTIFDAAMKTATPLATGTENSQNGLFEAVKAGKSDDEIKAMAMQQGAARGQILALQAETFAKMLALLTPDQKGEAGILIYDGIGQFLSNAHAPAPVNLPPVNVPSANTPAGQTAPAR